jgi:hypothetical protein
MKNVPTKIRRSGPLVAIASHRAMSRSAWTAAVNRRPQRQAWPPGTTPATHLIQTVQSNSAFQNQARKQENQTKIKPLQTKKIITVATMVVVRNNSCPHGGRDAVTNPYSSRFFHSKPFKVFQRHSKQFKGFSMHQFFIFMRRYAFCHYPPSILDPRFVPFASHRSRLVAVSRAWSRPFKKKRLFIFL